MLMTLVVAFTPSLRPWLPVAWRLLLWCTVGFLFGNLVMVLVMLAVGEFVFPSAEGSWLQAPAGVLGGCVIFLGPFVASAASSTPSATDGCASTSTGARSTTGAASGPWGVGARIRQEREPP